MTTAAPAAPAQPEIAPQTADPTPAAAPAVDTRPPLERMTPEQRADFWKTGETPNLGAADPDDEPEPATPGTAAGQTPPPAQDAGARDALGRFVRTPKPAGLSQRQHEKNELIRAATDLERENARLQAQLEESRRGGSARAPEQPAAQPTQQPEWDGVIASDPKPTIEQFADQDDPYFAHKWAEKQWESRNEARVQELRTAQTAARTAYETAFTAYHDRMVAYAATRPGFQQQIRPVLDKFETGSAFARDVMESPVAAQLLEHFATHPEDFDRIAQSTDHRSAQRALAKLEARFESNIPVSPQPAAEAPAPAAPVHNLVPKAPPPAQTLGTRPAEPADASQAALTRKDFRAFDAAETEKDLARFKRA